MPEKEMPVRPLATNENPIEVPFFHFYLASKQSPQRIAGSYANYMIVQSGSGPALKRPFSLRARGSLNIGQAKPYPATRSLE